MYFRENFKKVKIAVIGPKKAQFWIALSSVYWFLTLFIYFFPLFPKMWQSISAIPVILSLMNFMYRPFHKTLPRSSAFVNVISGRFYETGCSSNFFCQTSLRRCFLEVLVVGSKFLSELHLDNVLKVLLVVGFKSILYKIEIDKYYWKIIFQILLVVSLNFFLIQFVDKYQRKIH